MRKLTREIYIFYDQANKRNRGLPWPIHLRLLHSPSLQSIGRVTRISGASDSPSSTTTPSSSSGTSPSLPGPTLTSSIYDHLRKQGLPIGLLPKGITDYSLNGTTGEFRVLLEQPCHAKFENQVLYDFNVSGFLSFGRIANLSGVSAQELFLWFPVKGIRVDVPSSGLIYFDVGVVDKQFSLSLFESPPDCTAVDPSDPNFNPAAFENESLNLGYRVGRKSELRADS